MSVTDDFPDVLQNLESAVADAWRDHPEMSDYAALAAYEAAFQFYRDEMRGHIPKSSGLQGLDGEVFNRVKSICEFRLGRGPAPGPAQEPAAEEVTPTPLDKLVDCLRTLVRSVKLHTSLAGPQGYLAFIVQFLD